MLLQLQGALLAVILSRVSWQVRAVLLRCQQDRRGAPSPARLFSLI
jgi:hypothetical protein